MLEQAYVQCSGLKQEMLLLSFYMQQSLQMYVLYYSSCLNLSDVCCAFPPCCKSCRYTCTQGFPQFTKSEKVCSTIMWMCIRRILCLFRSTLISSGKKGTWKCMRWPYSQLPESFHTGFVRQWFSSPRQKQRQHASSETVGTTIPSCTHNIAVEVAQTHPPISNMTQRATVCVLTTRH